jgi:hypothetical protein
MRSNIAIGVVGVLGFLGCASQPPPAPASPPPTPAQTSAAAREGAAPAPNTENAPPAAAASGSNTDAIDRHLRVPKLRLGHYSSGDGLTGFVFDRTGAKPQIRMDGTSEIIELTPRGAPHGQTDLAHGIQGVIIRVGEDGQVTYFRGPRGDSVRMIRDADAEPLKK